MSNPLNDPFKNPLKKLYEEFWVPIFGRVLNLFTSIIEGEVSSNKQTYDLRNKSVDK